MNPTRFLFLCLLALSGCPYVTEKEGIDLSCLDNPRADMPQTDMTMPPPKCAAAKGLSGDNLLCVDFSQVSGLNDPKLMGWDFVGKCGGNYWEIVGAKLQIKSFNSFADTCGLTLPPIDLTLAKYSQYSSVTIALRHKVDLDPGTISPNQFAWVYLDTATPARVVTQTTNTQFEQQLVITIDKQGLPAALNSVYKWLLQVSSATAQNKLGWQISSIAVMGNP